VRTRNRVARLEDHILEGKDVIAKVFAGMRNNRNPGVGMKKLYSKHSSILAELVELAVGTPEVTPSCNASEVASVSSHRVTTVTANLGTIDPVVKHLQYRFPILVAEVNVMATQIVSGRERSFVPAPASTAPTPFAENLVKLCASAIFAGLSQRELMEILSCARMRTFTRDELLYSRARSRGVSSFSRRAP